MKCYSLMAVFILATLITAAQNQKDAYENAYLGWIKIFNPNEPEKPYTQDNRVYSVKQMAISRMIIGWIQQSYTPKGAIGQALKLVNPKLNLYNENVKALPQMYGANTKTYIELKKNAENKWTPETNTHWWMDIAVNGKIGDYSQIITSPDTYYFYIPGENGLGEDEQRVANMRGFSSHPTFKKYISWYQPKGIATTLQYVVLLCKDNVKPFVKVTNGEYLAELEKAIERDAKEDIRRGDNAASVNALLIKRKAELAKLKERNKSRLSEPAKQSKVPGLHLENTSSAESFENANHSGNDFIYKLDPAKLALTKSDQPQWILIAWEAEGVANGNEAGAHLHQSMLDNINYDYIYNYFFYPEKIKGIAYKPLKSPTEEIKNSTTEASTISKKNAADASVIFFDDFSQNAAGQKPIGWKSELNLDANYASVTTLPGKDGKWLEIKGQNKVIPLNLKKPLPQDFELSFDLAVPRDIPWGAKAFVLYLGTAKNYVENGPCINLRIRAGFSGRPGETSLECKFGSTYPVNTKPYYDATGFSNDKEINKVTITLKKKGESLEYFIDKNKIADISKAVPPGTLFNWLQLSHLRSDGDNQKYYFGNLKITKL
ncbi:hypothetical protein [Lacibacter sediminis]|uniref:Uncharacterized protein n=1 Tax=Lacibacter sediminis TaxID=2760713 RepID=A0A7G5XLN3_9BACT|nr:hypothetical protein [Lacibacter sediminis]QNA46386.1 hypothetical protein H4075_09505 [Lacibacter sediminis]